MYWKKVCANDVVEGGFEVEVKTKTATANPRGYLSRFKW